MSRWRKMWKNIWESKLHRTLVGSLVLIVTGGIITGLVLDLIRGTNETNETNETIVIVLPPPGQP